MSKRENKQPDWELTAEWGIKRDPYNWTLVYRPLDSKSTRWKERGYYPTIEQLIMAWYRKIGRTSPGEHQIMDHLSRCSRDVSEAAERLARAIEASSS
jgi:hypothetical protein